MDHMREIIKLKPDGKFELNLKYFRHHNEKIEYQWDSGSPRVGILFSNELEKLLGSARLKTTKLTNIIKILLIRFKPCMRNLFFSSTK